MNVRKHVKKHKGLLSEILLCLFLQLDHFWSASIMPVVGHWVLGDRARGVSRYFVGPGQKIPGHPSHIPLLCYVNSVNIVISRVVEVEFGMCRRV